MRKLIEFRNIVKSFDGQVVLKGINLNINENEFVTLLGPSGCGKTTLLRILGGFLEQDEGTVIFDGKCIDKVPAYKREINTVFQRYALFPHMNVFENIAFGLRIKKLGNDIINQKVNRMLSLVNLEGYEKRNVTKLSGGQQQRVAIARAVASNPKLLLLDEPLSNLDARLRIDMRSELLRLHRDLGTTIIYVTHDQVEALTMSTRIALFKNGELSQVSTPVELYMNPVDLQAADFIGNPRINFLEGTAEMEADGLRVRCALGEYLFPKGDMTEEPVPKGEFKIVAAVRPEQIRIETAKTPGCLPVTVYANQPAGSETLVSLQAGKSDFLAKQLGLVNYRINQELYVRIPPEKINIYAAESTRLIKRTRIGADDLNA